MKKTVALTFYLFFVVLTQQTFAADGQLLAGTAKINITPASDEPLHDSVYARVLVLDMDGRRITGWYFENKYYTSI